MRRRHAAIVSVAVLVALQLWVGLAGGGGRRQAAAAGDAGLSAVERCLAAGGAAAAACSWHGCALPETGVCVCIPQARGATCELAPPPPADGVADPAAPRRAVVATVANSGYAELLGLWLEAVRARGIEDFVVLALDDGVATQLRRAGVAGRQVLLWWELEDGQTPAREAVEFGTGAYQSLVRYKGLLARHLVASGAEVLLTDVDVLLVGDVWRSGFSGPCECDFEIALDATKPVLVERMLEAQRGSQCITGATSDLSPSVMRLCPTARTEALLALWLALMQTHHLQDQALWNYAVGAWEGSLSLRVLDPDLFPSGRLYFVDKAVDPALVLTIHNNWLVRSARAKLLRLREHRVTGVPPSDIGPNERFVVLGDGNGTATLQGPCAEAEFRARAMMVLARQHQRTWILPPVSCDLCACSPRCRKQVLKTIAPPCYFVDVFELPPASIAVAESRLLDAVADRSVARVAAADLDAVPVAAGHPAFADDPALAEALQGFRFLV